MKMMKYFILAITVCFCIKTLWGMGVLERITKPEDADVALSQLHNSMQEAASKADIQSLQRVGSSIDTVNQQLEQMADKVNDQLEQVQNDFEQVQKQAEKAQAQGNEATYEVLQDELIKLADQEDELMKSKQDIEARQQQALGYAKETKKTISRVQVPSKSALKPVLKKRIKPTGKVQFDENPVSKMQTYTLPATERFEKSSRLIEADGKQYFVTTDKYGQQQFVEITSSKQLKKLAKQYPLEKSYDISKPRTSTPPSAPAR